MRARARMLFDCVAAGFSVSRKPPKDAAPGVIVNVFVPVAPDAASWLYCRSETDVDAPDVTVELNRLVNPLAAQV